MTALKRAVGATVALTGLIWLCTVIDPLEQLRHSSPGPTDSAESAQPAPGGRGERASAIAIRRELTMARIVERRPDVAGYDRGCRRQHACVFGPAWTDNHDAPGGRNGCDTRNDVLRGQLMRITTKAGTRGCVVLAGQLLDPYTGRLLEFRKDAARHVQIDHVFSLARAWDLGASTWTQHRRVAFANDLTNLVATEAAVNASKADHGPGEWLPLSRAARCVYVLRYLVVANRYQLAITRGDQLAARAVAPRCHTRPAPR